MMREHTGLVRQVLERVDEGRGEVDEERGGVDGEGRGG